MSMIKLAEKSNPDAIPAIEKMKKSTLQNDKSEIDEKKVRDSKTVKPKQFKTKKVAKDDMELAKARKKEIGENLEKNFPKKSKDDMELLKLRKMAIELQNIDVGKIDSSGITDCVNKLTKFYDKATSLLDDDDPMVRHINELNKLMDTSKFNDKEHVISLGKIINGIIDCETNITKKEWV